MNKSNILFFKFRDHYNANIRQSVNNFSNQFGSHRIVNLAIYRQSSFYAKKIVKFKYALIVFLAKYLTVEHKKMEVSKQTISNFPQD